MRRCLLCFTWQVIVVIIAVVRHYFVFEFDGFDLGCLWLCFICLLSLFVALIKAVCIIVFFFVWRCEQSGLISVIVEHCLTIVEQVGRLQGSFLHVWVQGRVFWTSMASQPFGRIQRCSFRRTDVIFGCSRLGRPQLNVQSLLSQQEIWWDLLDY